MFALSFHFPAGRYHATPWGRNVNEAEVAWPPEPWRLLRALIATYWRKGDHGRWPQEALGRLIDALAETLPVYRLPEGAVHAHTRHYMPQARGRTTLIFDAFVRIPEQGPIIAAWPAVTLDTDVFSLGADLAGAIGYLGRAESWTECEALAEWDGEPNCGPVEEGFCGDPVRLLAALPPAMYRNERERLIVNEKERIRMVARKLPSARKLETEATKALRSKTSGMDTVPERLVDALALDTADYQDRRWHRPPAAREILYARDERATAVVTPRLRRRRADSSTTASIPTVARYLLAGRPRPRVEDTIRIGELMRLAALSQFGWRRDDSSGRRIPKAPWQISGRDSGGRPLRDPAHRHAFWLPEDADSDGLIDHVSVFVPAGIVRDVQTKLDRITRLWVERKRGADDDDVDVAGTEEWRLALEGFGNPSDFADSAPAFGRSMDWRSATPFLAAGHLKSERYAGEFRRLVRRMGMDERFGFDAARIDIRELKSLRIGGAARHALHFHRFRSRGGEKQHDTRGALLQVTFPVPVDGPLAMGYGCHFGLGLFVAC
ncbi:MAG: type I-U CRISPR-associated protein Csb2 [Chromatiales bacterium]|nr:type I-U CRISPR-associated protein Csb2 [Chromatiales bacterium]